MECEPIERVLYKQFVTDADNMRLERGGTVTPIHEISVIPRPSWSNPWNGGVARPESASIPSQALHKAGLIRAWLALAQGMRPGRTQHYQRRSFIFWRGSAGIRTMAP